jgi:hypothetical protein
MGISQSSQVSGFQFLFYGEKKGGERTVNSEQKLLRDRLAARASE